MKNADIQAQVCVAACVLQGPPAQKEWANCWSLFSNIRNQSDQTAFKEAEYVLEEEEDIMMDEDFTKMSMKIRTTDNREDNARQCKGKK